MFELGVKMATANLLASRTILSSSDLIIYQHLTDESNTCLYLQINMPNKRWRISALKKTKLTRIRAVNLKVACVHFSKQIKIAIHVYRIFWSNIISLNISAIIWDLYIRWVFVRKILFYLNALIKLEFVLSLVWHLTSREI